MPNLGTIRAYSITDKLIFERYYYTVEARRRLIFDFGEDELIHYVIIIPQYIKYRKIIADKPKPPIIRPEAKYDNNKPTNGLYKYD